MNYETALSIATFYHKGQVDKCGVDYILHPIAVAYRCSSKSAEIVALLHDVLEDTVCTPDILTAAGISPEELKGVLLMTHDKPNITYFEYIRGLYASGNALALEVKMADIKHNLSRPYPGDGGLKAKYAKAVKILKGEIE